MKDVRPRRSVLVLPGNNRRFMGKAAASEADVVLLDLEDSVVPAELPGARQSIIDGLRSEAWGGQIRTVRVNAISTPYFYQDLIAVVEGAGAYIDAIVLPKVNAPGDVYMLDMLLGQIEAAHNLPYRIGIEAQIETAPAMRDVDQIAQTSSRLVSLVFGPGDFAAAMGMPMLDIGDIGADYPGNIWQAHLSRVLVAARAAGIAAIDGPYGALGDMEGLALSARLSRMLGYDGKWAVHPTQINTINTIFSPTPQEIERAEGIMRAYQQAVAAGSGAIRDDAVMLDRASVAMAERVLGRVRGYTATPP